MKKRTSVSLSVKGGRWRVRLGPKTLSRQGRGLCVDLPLRKKNLSRKGQSKLQSKKGLLAARVARTLLAPLLHHLGAQP